VDGFLQRYYYIILGLGIRWQFHFNFSMLRMVSFTMDYYWKQKLPTCNVVVSGSIATETDRERIQIPLESEDDYKYLNYLTYMVNL
jgi:hypothetical protein